MKRCLSALAAVSLLFVGATAEARGVNGGLANVASSASSQMAAVGAPVEEAEGGGINLALVLGLLAVLGIVIGVAAGGGSNPNSP